MGGIMATYDRQHPYEKNTSGILPFAAGQNALEQSYSRYVSELARYYHRSPELISYQEVADWLYYLVKERHLSASSVNIAVNAVRFLYGITLERNTEQLMARVPRMKRTIRRSEIYARSELEAILRAPSQPRDGVFLMTTYCC